MVASKSHATCKWSVCRPSTTRKYEDVKQSRIRLATVSVLAATLIVAPAGVAQAEGLVTSNSVTTTETEEYTSTFTLEFEKPTKASEAKQEVKEATAAMPTVTAQAGTAKPKCNTMYNRNDANGHFSMQQKCGGSKIQWGFKIHKNLQKNITGKVKEDGLNWSKNGKKQTNNSPHKVPKDYHFHGSLSAKNGDVITYSNSFSFPYKITRTGHIKFKGKIVFQKNPKGSS